MAQIDRLEQLHVLLQKGALTPAEYATAKARLMSDHIIWGICGRLGQATPITSGGWRLLFLLPVFAGMVIVPTFFYFTGWIPNQAATTAYGSALVAGPAVVYFLLYLGMGEAPPANAAGEMNPAPATKAGGRAPTSAEPVAPPPR